MRVTRALVPCVSLALLAACSSAPKTTTGSIDGRVHLVNESLSLSNGAKATSKAGGVSTQTFSAAGSTAYTYAASVYSPKNAAGDRLQATNFAFDDAHAYVTYNMAGDAIDGAFDIMDMSDAANPRLVASLVTTDGEYADVALSDHYAFLAGADANGGSLAVIDISDPVHPTRIATLSLGSKYATSIAIDGTTAYLSTGDSGGVARVDITVPSAPTLLDLVPLPNALSVARKNGVTLALGGDSETHLYAIDAAGAHDLAKVGDERFEAPGRMAVAGDLVYSNGGHTGLSVLRLAADGSSASLAFHSDMPGTGNAVALAGNLAILAQGEVGTELYDLASPTTPAWLGSFAFPDEWGSANEVRFGTSGGNDYVFLGDGLDGLRIVKINAPTEDTGAVCSTKWWLEEVPSDWWASPATNDDASPGTWVKNPAETSGLCRVEQFVPTAANAQCSAIQLKRAIAIGPQPNEGQKCPVTCPPGTVIANVHTRYGEASPLNDGGDYTCTGTTEPDSHEIDCDAMSDFCNGTHDSCSVTYSNAVCGDPWYYCIKSGRTKWQCVPEATGDGH